MLRSKNVTKKVNYTTVSCVEVRFENNEVINEPLEDIELQGVYTKESADIKASKHYKGKNVLVTGVQNVTKVYTMDVDRFMELAECETIAE